MKNNAQELRETIAEEVRQLANDIADGTITRAVIIGDDGQQVMGGTYGAGSTMTDYLGMIALFQHQLIMTGKKAV